MLSDEQREEIRKDTEYLKISLDDFKKNPDKYTTPEYTTPDGSVICVINSNEYTAIGVILHGPFKGLINSFLWSELSPIGITKITEEDPYGEEQWEGNDMKNRIKRFRDFIQ